MTVNDVEIGFADVDAAEAGDLVTDLEEHLAEKLPAVRTQRLRPDRNTQDLGTVLGIVLGSTSVATLAGGVATWLSKRHTARMVLRRRRSDGSTVSVTVHGQPTARTQAIITEFLK